VTDAGVLTGHGRIGGDLAVMGVIAPGNGEGSYESLSIGGNYSQAAGSVYVAQWSPQYPGSSSRIAVDGKATLSDGAIAHLVSPGGTQFNAGTRYTLLTADQGLTGTYSLIGDTSFSAVLALTPFYDANHFYLDITQQRLLPELAYTSNQRATLTAVQALSSASAPSIEVTNRQSDPQMLAATPVASIPFVTLTNLQSDPQIRYAADQLSGEIYASAQNTFLEDSRFVRDAVATRLRLAGSDGQNKEDSSSQSVTTQANGLASWGQFVGSWGRRDSDANDASLSHTLGGFLVGADMAVGGSSRIGVVSGYTQTAVNVSQRGSNVSSNDVHLGIYAGTQLAGLGLSLGTAYTRHDFDADRSILFPGYVGSVHGNSKAYAAQVFGEADYRFQFKAVALEPFLQGAHVRLNTDSFREYGDAMALSANADRHAVTYSTLGARAFTHFLFNGDAFTAHASLGWRHVFGGVQPEANLAFANGSPFTVQGLPIARNALAVDTGLDLRVNKQTTISLSYNGQLAAHAIDSGFKGSFTWQFD
jgi:outer membrane autotransporter protein